MASAYAALLALARSLREILDLEQHIDPLHKEKIVSLHEKVDFIVTFLEDHSDKYHETLGRVGNEIRKAAFEAQDFMDSYHCSVLTTDEDGSSSEANGDKVNLDRDLTMAFERIGVIWDEMMKMKNSDTAQDFRPVSYSSPVDRSSTVQATAKKMVVGFDDDLIAIKERLYEDAAELQIIPIVGMGGIGKTTLAKRAYEDSLFDQHFDIRAWITVSAEYQRRQILSGLLHDLEKCDGEKYHGKSDAELKTLVYQNLKGRRYLIVVDDIWSPKAWDYFKMILPDDGNGSRILLTTRILDVAAHLGSSDTPIHQMNCLNEDQSWKLLQERVFGQQSCPLQLVTAGKKIAKNCGGLPLTIVVVAGLLLSTGGILNEQLWEKVAENISFREPTIALQCSKILCISYDRLPLRLKPCFLYISAFPEDSEIEASKLIKLWVAEGFLKPNDQSKCLEDVGERYLKDLVNRSLLFVSSQAPDEKIETVGIHDMLREICVTMAEEEGFLHHNSSSSRENPYRRITCYEKRDYDDTPDIQEPGVRSLLLLPDFYAKISWLPRHLFIFDALEITLTEKELGIISTCLNLRYLGFSIYREYGFRKYAFPVSILKHPTLETIVIHTTYSQRPTLPFEILMKPKLRHLICSYFLLSYPYGIGIVHESDLQTLARVVDLIFTEKIIKILVNLKRLSVEYNMDNRRWYCFNFDNLVHLQNLEDLKLIMDFGLSSPDPSMKWSMHAFPIGLKKLYLRGVPLPRESMTLIGSLPNLQMFRMKYVSIDSSEWRTVEGQFLRLTYFRCRGSHLANGWKTEKEHFPCLETLVLEYEDLMEIPRGIGEIDTLQYIELNCCKQSPVDSAKQIQRLQHENGNDAFRMKIVDDARPASRRVVESFLNKFFPSGYPYSVNEGYLRYTQFRALQHFTSATLSVLSTQSLLFAAGLRPTPAQATAVSWILKDGMQHVGKLICSNLGARMDSEPKSWRILGLFQNIVISFLAVHEMIDRNGNFLLVADVLYDLGAGLEVLSPLCPQLFLEMAGLGNFAKGMAVVAARATRLPIYSSFAKEGNLSDLFAKGEAISTLCNVFGIGVGIQLASTICSSMKGKLIVGPFLSLIHVYCVSEEMRATPVNTLNPQRTAMIVADFLKTGRVSSPADLRYREDLLFPGRLIEEAGNVKIGRAIHEVLKPSELHHVKERFPDERFILSCGAKWTDLILERSATGEDALRGWLVAAYAADIENSLHMPSENVLAEAFDRMYDMFPSFLSEVRAKGWHTDRFLDGARYRFKL